MPEDLLESTARSLHYRLACAQRDGRAPSIAAGVVRGGRLVWSAGVGAMVGEPKDVAYRIASITKTFTAVLVLQLRDEGKLDLTDPLPTYLPEIDSRSTLAQLLAHTSGLTSELPGEWFERVTGSGIADLISAIREEPARLVAGSRLHYSNVGFALLGEVVARLRGAPWEQVLQERILDPLGLTRTGVAPSDPAADGWAVHPHADVLLREPAVDIGAMGPCGQLWSSVDDLGQWLTFLCGQGGPSAAAVLSPETLAEMRQPASVMDGDAWDSGFGLGLQLHRVDGRSLVGHGGSLPGFVSTIWAEPATGDGVAVLANSTSGVPVGQVADDLLRLLADREPALPAPWQPAPVEAAVLELAGTWYWGPTAFTLSVVGSADLRLAAPGSSRTSTFHPAGRDTWIGQDAYYAGETLRAVRDQDGRLRHLDVATFVFTREPYDPAAAIPGGVDEDGWHSPGQAESEARRSPCTLSAGLILALWSDRRRQFRPRRASL